MSSAATSMRIWTSAAAANRAANSACSTATSRKDLYDVIEWLGRETVVERQGRRHRPILFLHVAMVDGDPETAVARLHLPPSTGSNDPYRASVYQGGMLGDFFGSYWWNQNRIINRHPANGEYPREQTCDLNLLIQQHPTYDEFWRERAAAEHLHQIEVPLYSVGVWGKVDLHTRGNIDGFRRAARPEEAEDDRAGECLRRQPRVQQPRAARKDAAAVLRSLSQRRCRPNICSARQSNISCAAPTPCAAPRPGRRPACAM